MSFSTYYKTITARLRPSDLVASELFQAYNKIRTQKKATKSENL